MSDVYHNVNMAILPCALFSAPDISDAFDLIRQLLNVDELPCGEEDDGYKWNINNKYYTAQVQLYALPNSASCRQYTDSVQAVILYFDADEESSFKTVQSWLPFLQDSKPAVQIIVCRHCSDFTAVPRLTILNWCLENGMELVELKPDFNDDEDFQEPDGITRIIQALHAHTWPNLEMKQSEMLLCKSRMNAIVADTDSEVCSQSLGEDQDRNSHSDELENVSQLEGGECKVDDRQHIGASEHHTGTSKQHTEASEHNTGISKKHTEASEHHIGAIEQPHKEHGQQDNTEKLIENFFNDETEDSSRFFESVESFESLCERIGQIQVKASQLSPNQRKKFAEKTTMSFWRAIGGDMDEIDCDSSDSET
ncbi:uncharacterized protein LOC115230905 [Argonauta hians]